MNIKDLLARRIKKAKIKLRGVRRNVVNDIFERLLYILPHDIQIINYLREKPLASFNPGVLKVSEDKINIFPRLIFDYHTYASSIGMSEKISIEKIINRDLRKPLKVKIVLWPRELWEFNGCEDARIFIFKNKIFITYTAYGFLRHHGKFWKSPQLALAIFNEKWREEKRKLLKIIKDNEIFIPTSHKDSAIIRISNETAILLTRPEINGVKICWRALASLKNFTIEADTLYPVLVNENFEEHVGWSTNVVKLSSNEYLVGWHAMLSHNLAYYNGLAIVNEEGELMGISDYLLMPKGIYEEYGDRPHVIFGNGLLIYKDFLIWIGGISDYCIGIFVTELEKALSKIRWLKG